MASIFGFKCSECEEIHEGAPSFGFRAPDPYLEQTQAVQSAGRLSGDLCWYQDADGDHYFLRTCLEIPIHGIAEPYIWGVWVSVSEKSFNRYVDTYKTPDPDDVYFGFLCNHLPYYPDTYGLKTQVHSRGEGKRPYIVPEQTDHPLSIDFHHGISVARAQEIAEMAFHRSAKGRKG